MILCTCGWGTLADEALPHYCPLCGFDLWSYFQTENDE